MLRVNLLCILNSSHFTLRSAHSSVTESPAKAVISSAKTGSSLSAFFSLVSLGVAVSLCFTASLGEDTRGLPSAFGTGLRQTLDAGSTVGVVLIAAALASLVGVEIAAEWVSLGMPSSPVTGL